MSRPAYEKSDFNTKTISVFAVALTVVIVVTGAASWGILKLFNKQHRMKESIPSMFVNERPMPPDPRLQSNPGKEFDLYYSAQMKRLNSYAWVDKNRGIARIPIEKAIENIAEKGLPAR